LKLIGTGLTDVGSVRKHNEDSLLVDNELEVFVVADGVGGQSAGEVASRMAVDIISDYMRNIETKKFVGTRNESYGEATNNLASAIRFANRVIHEAARSAPTMNGMGSTVVALTRQGDKLSVVHAGDSRAYMVREGVLNRLTDDHSLVMEQVRKGLISEKEAQTSRVKNIITRALGAAPEVDADMEEIDLEPGDIMVLCSDGLSNMVKDETLLAAVTSGEPAEAVCRQLVSLANEQGGTDNITVVLVEARKGGFMGLISKIFNN